MCLSWCARAKIFSIFYFLNGTEQRNNISTKVFHPHQNRDRCFFAGIGVEELGNFVADRFEAVDRGEISVECEAFDFAGSFRDSSFWFEELEPVVLLGAGHETGDEGTGLNAFKLAGEVSFATAIWISSIHAAALCALLATFSFSSFSSFSLSGKLSFSISFSVLFSGFPSSASCSSFSCSANRFWWANRTWRHKLDWWTNSFSQRWQHHICRPSLVTMNGHRQHELIYSFWVWVAQAAQCTETATSTADMVARMTETVRSTANIVTSTANTVTRTTHRTAQILIFAFVRLRFGLRPRLRLRPALWLGFTLRPRLRPSLTRDIF